MRGETTVSAKLYVFMAKHGAPGADCSVSNFLCVSNIPNNNCSRSIVGDFAPRSLTRLRGGKLGLLDNEYRQNNGIRTGNNPNLLMLC